MTALSFKIINHSSLEYEAAVKLREGILRKPLGLTFSLEELEAEKEHIQIAGFQGDKVISTAVLVPEGADKKWRGESTSLNGLQNGDYLVLVIS